VIKSRRIKWVGHVALMGERSVYRVLVGKLMTEDPGIDGRIILRWILIL